MKAVSSPMFNAISHRLLSSANASDVPITIVPAQMHIERIGACANADTSRARVFGYGQYATRPHAHTFLGGNSCPRPYSACACFWVADVRTSLAGAHVFGTEPFRSPCFCVRVFLCMVRAITLFPCAHVFGFGQRERTSSLLHSRAHVFVSEQFATSVFGHTKAPPETHLEGCTFAWEALRDSAYRVTLTRRLLPGRSRRSGCCRGSR